MTKFLDLGQFIVSLDKILVVEMKANRIAHFYLVGGREVWKELPANVSEDKFSDALCRIADPRTSDCRSPHQKRMAVRRGAAR